MAISGIFATFLWLLAAMGSVEAYWLMSMGNFIITERMDPIVSPNAISGHSHSVLGGSNFGPSATTKQLRESKCTSAAVTNDKSNYWFPHLYFQWANGSFSSLTGGSVADYLFDDKAGVTTAFPDDFRMISGDPTLRTYNASSHAQQAVTFLCLDFNGASTRHNEIPAQACPSGVRAQINFPSCWDGKNLDSADHKSHVAFKSGGPDSGTCNDPKFPVTLPRIFMEVYWGTEFEAHRSEAKNPSQPYVYSYGDTTGYGYHADFINGWDAGVLQKAVDGCHCNPYGDPTCCAQAGIFNFESKPQQCHITPQINEVVVGTLPKLPGNNPVQTAANAVGGHVKSFVDANPPGFLSPTTAYTTDTPPAGSCQVGHGNDIGARCKLNGAPAPSLPANTTSAPANSGVPSSGTVTSSSGVVTTPVAIGTANATQATPSATGASSVTSSSVRGGPSSVPHYPSANATVTSSSVHSSSSAHAAPVHSSAHVAPVHSGAPVHSSVHAAPVHSSAHSAPIHSSPHAGPIYSAAPASSSSSSMPIATKACKKKNKNKKHSAKFAQHHHYRARRSYEANFH